MANVAEVIRDKVPANDTRLYYEAAGEGPALVLLHAGMTDSRMWDSQFLDMSRHCRVIRYDRRGFGQSGPAQGAFSHSRDLLALLQALSVDRAHLLGCSQGGGIALDFTLQYPAMAQSLILESTSLGGYPLTGPIPAPLVELGERLQEGDMSQAAELAVQLWLLGPFRTARQVDSRLQKLVFDMSRQALPNYFVAEETVEPAAMVRLGEIRIPTLVLVGDQDDSLALEIGETLNTAIPDCRMVTIPCSGHLINMEKPREFNRLVLRFLQGHSEPANPVC